MTGRTSASFVASGTGSSKILMTFISRPNKEKKSAGSRDCRLGAASSLMKRSPPKRVVWKQSKGARKSAAGNPEGRCPMKESSTHLDLGIPQGLRAGRQSTHLDRFDSQSAATTGPLQTVEPLIDCVGAAAVLGGLHPKTVER